MVASTEAGNLRTYKYPLSGEFTEVKVHQVSEGVTKSERMTATLSAVQRIDPGASNQQQ
jgi:hypothetical protein